MLKFSKVFLLVIFAAGCSKPAMENEGGRWQLSVLPSSVRLDPVTNEIIEDRFSGIKDGISREGNLLNNNWIYDGESVSLHGARGEYVSFQVVLTNATDSMLTDMRLEMAPFKSNDTQFEISPEMFLEWSVEVK